MQKLYEIFKVFKIQKRIVSEEIWYSKNAQLTGSNMGAAFCRQGMR